ncbi:type IX secretion system protein PorD [Flavobacterium silvaticum]|uniref:DUF4835 family protein n=1 Tax=Flavobacterium silvaticum TaxID=1852020 RepID=A0A972JHD6_9FLAO|nr:DUF4835 family protein [Flavobacterium silvaticum]NMH29126.1 DUF4835 family protein [Flavobacterium silvaticum]
MRNIFWSLFLFTGLSLQAQELNCTVSINADQAGLTNNQVFKTLENSISDFVNRTDWTGQGFNQNERISCSMYITVTSYSNNQFAASIQVQSARPVFDSTYSSPVFNFNDKDFNFDYTEFQNLIFNPGTFDSNLVSVLAFYSFIMIGIDADTFSPNGGQSYFENAQDIANAASNTNYKGWKQSDGNQNRYFLINDLLSSTYSAFHDTMYEYHRNGLDKMSIDPKAAKEAIAASMETLAKVNAARPNAFLTRVFFDSKSDELVSIYSGGPSIPIAPLIDRLNKLSPLNSSKWSGIKM